MSPKNDANRRLGEFVRQRRDELGLAQKGLEGISDASVRRIEQGDGPPTHPKQRRALTHGLQWTPDSIDVILAGGEPEPLAERLDPLWERVIRLEGRFDELSRQFQALLQILQR